MHHYSSSSKDKQFQMSGVCQSFSINRTGNILKSSDNTCFYTMFLQALQKFAANFCVNLTYLK